MDRKEYQMKVKCKVDETEPADFERAISLTGYGKYNYILLLSAVTSALSHQCNTTIMSYLLPAAECDLQMSHFKKGMLNAIPYIGMICSAFMWGFLSDTTGRRALLVVAYTLDGICNLIASVSQTYWFLLMFKFFSGFIICGPLSMQKTFLAEFHGAHHRARIIMYTGVFVASANILIPVVAWTIIPLEWSWQLFDGMFTYNSWRLFVTVCSLPSLLSAIFIYNLKESPKFLMSCGRYEEALQVFQTVYSVNKGKDPKTYPVKVLQDEKLKGPSILTSGIVIGKNPLAMIKVGWKQTKPLFFNPHRPRAMLTFCLQFWTLLGMNTLRLWLPQLFASMEEYNHHQELHNASVGSVSLCEMLYFSRPENETALSQGMEGHCSVGMLRDKVYTNSMLVGAATALAFLCASYSINALGKKTLMVLGFLSGGASGIAIYWSRDEVTTLALSSAYVALIGVCHTVSIAVVVDLFPTSLRNMAVSLTMMCGQMGSILGNLIFPVLLDLSCAVPFFVIGGIVLGCAALCLLLPGTNSKSLE